MISKPALQKTLKEILHREEEDNSENIVKNKSH
jgi:hypothetical protein